MVSLQIGIEHFGNDVHEWCKPALIVYSMIYDVFAGLDPFFELGCGGPKV